MKKTIKWVLFIFWLIIIYIFSNQPNSGDTTHSIISNIVPSLKNTIELDIINFTFRKLAHITEYLILVILTISLLKEYTNKETIIIILSLIFCFLYACSDELHQLFVIGRTSKYSDVLIDTLGSLIGIIIYKRLFFKIKKEVKNENMS